MKNKGFSLVELIVVIAIMAILVGVAVPVYTSYIEKAQKSKDEQLVDEIKHAIEIAGAAGTFSEGDTGYLVLTTEGVSGVEEGSTLDTVLKQTFGNDYANTLKLSYDGWADNAGMLAWLAGSSVDGDGNSVANNTYAGIANVAGSSFLKGNTTDELMSNVENLTTKLASIVVDMDAVAKQGVMDMFTVGSKEDGTYSNALETVMAEQNYTLEEVDATTLSNLVVLAAAEEMKGKTEDSEASSMAQYVSLYAMYTAYAANENSSQAYKDDYAALQTQIQQENNPVKIMEALGSFSEKMYGNDTGTIKADAGWEEYSKATLDSDLSAFVSIMNAVDNGKIDSGSLQDAALFTTGDVSVLFNSYVDAVKMIDGMSEEEYNTLVAAAQNGGVTVLYSCVDNQVRVICSLPELN
ncbi:MAG: prepilin-type N-terminal cleavage/methylation domain-containing protein [Ruminococcaceae bacterium]|nr:prepilin-type N-terminal cleavage/methylation domain-containing protein [Oscillospiraceae bacterium]